MGYFVQNYFQERQSFTLLREYIEDVVSDLDFNGEIKEYITQGKGIITYSSDPEKVGYDLHDSDYMSEFLCIPDGTLYGEERLLSFISDLAGRIDAADRNEFCKEACEKMLSEVKRFESDAEQADDITMMWVKYIHGS